MRDRFVREGVIRCPHCGRPFVDLGRYRLHTNSCQAERQAELDRAWDESQERERRMREVLDR